MSSKVLKNTVGNPFQRSKIQIYEPLQHEDAIRLFFLEPGRGDDPLCGGLVNVGISNAPAYEALSYVWGNEEAVWPLHIAGRGWASVTSGLRSALFNLRDHKLTRTLWIDAICINQSDNEEKSRQVWIMMRIFKTAATVIAFLGEDGDDSAHALELLQKIDDIGDSPANKDFLLSGDLEALGLPIADDRSWEAMAALLGRPWFRRAWIVQEVIVAQVVLIMCGREKCAWRGLSASVKLVVKTIRASSMVLNELTSSGRIAMITMFTYRQIYQQGKKIDLLDIVLKCRFVRSTRARDHLFAFLGVSGCTDSDLLYPDYDEKFENVINRYAKHFIENSAEPMHLLYPIRG